MSDINTKGPQALIDRVNKYLAETDYLYDSGINDNERSEALPEHRQNIRDLAHVLQGVLDDSEQRTDYANRRLEAQRLEIKRLEELIRQIYVMCESDEESETKRRKYYEVEAKGDPLMKLQYGSTSHGCALQAAKVTRFIRSQKPEYRKAQGTGTP